jgi:ubiquinone/menaquinone biosynthesis C-methylase UbiE
MWMTSRSQEREILDDHEPEQPVVDKIYRFLSFVNRHLGGTHATLARFDAFSRSWKPGAKIAVLDVASGAADVPRALIAWAGARGFDVRVTALDVSPRALLYARRAGPVDRLGFVCSDIQHSCFRDGAFDYVTCALFFHHLTDAQVVTTLRTFNRLASRGIVVNDLVRARRAYLWSRLLTAPFHPILRFDGPLSVRRAFRPDELRSLAAQADVGWLDIHRSFGHRMTLSGQKGWSRTSLRRGDAGLPIRRHLGRRNAGVSRRKPQQCAPDVAGRV